MPGVGEDGGVQSLGVALGLHIGQAVDGTSCGTDAAFPLLREETAVAGVVVVGRRGHRTPPARSGAVALLFDIGIISLLCGSFTLDTIAPPCPRHKEYRGTLWSFVEFTMTRPRTTLEQDSALVTDSDFRRALLREVRRIYADDPSVLADPEATPILAELALRNSGAQDDSRQAIEELLLHNALVDLRRFDRFSGRELQRAIAELLGIGEKNWANQADRFDNAANELRSYKTGESLRKTKRVQQGSGGKYVWEIFLELLVVQLVILARNAGLIAPPLPAHTPSLRDSRPSSTCPGKRVNGALASEVRAVLINGTKHAIKHDGLSLLTKTADATYGPPGSARDRVEALLTWAIASLAVTDSRNIYALLALAGLDTKYQSDRATRQRRAYELQFPEKTYDPLDNANTFSMERFAYDLSEPLWELASELGISCGPCLEEMIAKRTFVEAPDPEINFMFGLILGATVGGTLNHITYAEWSNDPLMP